MRSGCLERWTVDVCECERGKREGREGGMHVVSCVDAPKPRSIEALSNGLGHVRQCRLVEGKNVGENVGSPFA